MTPVTKIIAAFDRCSSETPEILRGVYEKVEDDCRAAIALKLTSKVLLVVANPDDDTIAVRCEDPVRFREDHFSAIERTRPWRGFIGQSLGWGWATINQQGYCDGVLLSFGGVEPRVLLHVVGSSLVTCEIVSENDAGRRPSAFSADSRARHD